MDHSTASLLTALLSQKKSPMTMDDFDGMMSSFETYIRTPEADRKKLCADWRKPAPGAEEDVINVLKFIPVSVDRIIQEPESSTKINQDQVLYGIDMLSSKLQTFRA